MSSCFGWCSSGDEESEREPLLPLYRGDTALQTRLQEKLHTYQMLRAMSQGYMPSNDQVMIHLRSLLSSEPLTYDSPDLSDSGIALIRYSRILIKQFVELLQHKNAEDQVQDLIWCLAKARLDIDVPDMADRASRAKARADTAAAYRSLQTVGTLLLGNSDFRVFLGDLETVGRDIFKDTAFSLSNVSESVGKKVAPSEREVKELKDSKSTTKDVPTSESLQKDAQEATTIVAEGAREVADDAVKSVADHATGEEREALTHRLKQTVMNLRQRTDYSQSVSTISLLLRRYLLAYSHAAVDTLHAVEDDVEPNEEVDKAFRNAWSLIKSFGQHSHWEAVEKHFGSIVEHGKTDPNFDQLVEKLSTLVQDMLSDPDFFDHVEDRFQEVRSKSEQLVGRSSISEDVDAFLGSLRAALRSAIEDKDIQQLLQTSSRIANVLSPSGKYTNSQLVGDMINTFLPMAISAIQYVPIPRLEVSTPAIDLLLENLILEPGRTINQTSFLPYKLLVSTQNDVEIRKARFATTSSVTSLMTITIAGMSIAADDLGYWFRVHSGLLRFMDEGLAGFHVDEKGVDIIVDLEIGPDHLEKIVSLRSVKVKIHKLNYTLRKSKFSCLAWLFKPLIRPIARKAIEIKMAAAISDGLHFLNRELVYARERLRATRIANPADLWTFLKAVGARLVPAPDPDLETRVGIKAGEGVFKGRYAPGSLVEVWERDGRAVKSKVYQYDRGGWRNDIFDVKTVDAPQM